MIRRFRNKSTEAVFHGESPKGFPADLRSPPGNRLEALAGNRQGQHSIRINDQFRICFVWTAEGPADVEIADYH